MDDDRVFGPNAASHSSAVYKRCVSTIQQSLKRKTRIGHGNSSLRERIKSYVAIFDASPTQQLAYHTIIGQVIRHRLAWHDKTGNLLEDVPIPPWWYRFIQDAIRCILLTGCAFYKINIRKGMAVPEVADPCEVLPQYNYKKCVWEPDTAAWKGIFFEPPIHLPASCTGHVNNVMIRCASSRAFKATVRLNSLQENWSVRDNNNSRPSVYTSISSDLSNQNGSERQWFKNLTNPDVLQTRAVDIDSNFSSLVHKRADTIMKLDAQSHLMRQKNAERSSDFDNDATEPVQMHREHIVSDGRTFVEARPLSSLPDTKIIMDELMHSVFFAFGVPPQCLGKNINSERLASSNRLTEMAINSFHILIENMRRQLQTPIKEATMSANESYMGFGLVLDEHELNTLLPVLKTNHAASMIARTYRIPVNMIDKKRVSLIQQSDEKNNKRPRTENEAIAASRQRANQPDA